jgi:hypothetical protein
MEAPMRRSTTRHEGQRRTAPAERSPDQLWADCIAERPDIIDEIVTFVTAARSRLIASPPLAPEGDGRTPTPHSKPDSEPQSEPEPNPRSEHDAMPDRPPRDGKRSR